MTPNDQQQRGSSGGLLGLKSVPGVTGAALFWGGATVGNATARTEATCSVLGGVLEEMRRAYAASGREFERACLGFDRLHLLAHFRSRWALVIFVAAPDCLGPASIAAAYYLRGFGDAEPAAESAGAWTQFRDAFCPPLYRAVGAMEGNALLQAAVDLHATNGLPPIPEAGDFAAVAERAVARIGSRWKRRALSEIAAGFQGGEGGAAGGQEG